MSLYLQFAVLGLGLGTVYICLAAGLQLTYQATGIINLAQAGMATWGAYTFAQVRADGRLVLPVGTVTFQDPPGIWTCLFIGLAAALVLGVLTHYLIFRPVRHAPALAQVVASIGLMIALQALVVIRFGVVPVPVESFLPSGTVSVFGTLVAKPELAMTAIAVVLTVAIGCYLRFTRAGVATRAASENERGALVIGLSPDRLALVAVVVSNVIATLGIMMTSSLSSLSPSTYTLMVVPALAVVLAARLSSLTVVCLGGAGLGILQAELGLFATKTWWPAWAQSGLGDVVPFLIVTIMLLVAGKRLPARGSLQDVALPDVFVPRIRPGVAVLCISAAVVSLVLLNGTYRYALTMSLIVAVLALSFVVITGYLGQISLAQVSFAGAAGFVLSKVTTHWGLPFPLAIIVCALIAAALGVVVALPALRIRGVQLAIVTLAAALAIERFVFGNYSLTPASGNPVEPPTLFGIDFSVRAGRDISRLTFALLVLAVLVVMILVFARLANGSTGRAFLAVRANERAAASVGIDVRRTKFLGFGISAFFAGVAGCLLSFSAGQFSAESFTVAIGIQMVAIAYIGGITSIGGAITAGLLGPLGLLYTVLQELEMGDAYALVSGIGLVVAAITNPSGIAGATRAQIAWVRARLGPARPAPMPARARIVES